MKKTAEEKKGYVYPKNYDILTNMAIDKHAGGKVAWEKQEEDVLEYARDMYCNGHIFADFGCGTGRLIKYFKDCFTKIIAVDCDAAAIEETKNQVSNLHIFEQKVQNVDIEDPVDVVLMSHVLQHVNEADAKSLLEKSSMVLKNKGVLILTTCFSPGEKDIFKKSFTENGERVTVEISKEEFEGIVAKNELTREAVFKPTRYFSLMTIRYLLGKYGLEFIDSRPFHEINGIPKDIMIIAKKK